MAFQRIGHDAWIGVNEAWMNGFIGAGGFTSSVIDATGEKFAYVGRVWFSEGTGTKAIRRVGFRFGTVTKAGGSALTVSLQDVSLSAGPPAQPDGTQDQTVAIANADAGFASNLWYRTGTLSADRTVTYGDLLSVVIEYDGAGRLGSDAVNINHLSNNSFFPYQSSVLYTASWANVTGRGTNVVLEFDDGTFGTLEAGLPCSDRGFVGFNSGSTPDEYAMAFTVAAPLEIDGIEAIVEPLGAAADFDLVLYQGTTQLQSVSVDANALAITGIHLVRVPIPKTSLSVSTTYYVAVKPTTANSLRIYYCDVNDANHLTVWPLGSTASYSTRTDAGSWDAATATRRMLAGLRISGISDSSGSGGVKIAQAMTGGFVG